MTDRRRASAHLLVDSVETPALDDAATHHLRRVLRLRNGEPVTVTDGGGRWRRCIVSADDLVIDGEIETVPPPANPVTIGVAIPKQDRPEWIVQKLVECGVTRIVWLATDRTVVRWDDARAAKRAERFRRIAVEALQQSRQVYLPVVDGPIPATEFLPTAVAAEPGGRPIELDDRVVAIGPEGGWTDTELALARDRVALTDSVLRVETAAVVAAAILTRATGIGA